MGRPLRVLLVEDSQDDADVMAMQLRRGGYEPACARVETAAAMRAALGRQEWDVVISDYCLPDFSGPQALELLQELGLDIPFIVVTGLVGEDLAVAVMKAGAGDCLMKNSLVRLCPAVERELKDAQVRRGRRKAEGHQKLAIEILEILNRSDRSAKLISDLAHLLKVDGGFDAVGVRLRQGEDYPYIFGEGFPPDFLESARSLSTQGAAGGSGLDCFCGAVLRGRPDAACPSLTLRGSFSTNSMGETVASTPQARAGVVGDTRGHCAEAGFESVTLVPLSSGGEVLGLLHLAARRRGRFAPEDVVFLEDMAVSIGIALRRKRAEEEHEKLEEQMRQAQKREAIGRLAGGIAHDFNNLLTAINGYAQFLSEALPPPDARREDALEILSAGRKAAALTRQLLAFSRRQVLQPKVLSLDALIPEMSRLVCRIVGEDIECRLALGSAGANVKADPGQIEQVIMNLVVNARDAMPDGGLLTLATAPAELDEAYARSHPGVAPGRYVTLAVSDTGLGMTAEVQARIFEPFFTTKERGKGTGLGLSTVYGIIHQSGGSVFVYSEPGKGTSFKLYLPRVDDPAGPDTRSRTLQSSCRGSETLLVVDDDETVRKVLRRILTENGYTVLAAADPQEALALCRKHGDGISLLVTDVILPGMNGRKLAEEADALCPGIKVVFMSGYAGDMVSHHGILDEGLTFLEKPLSSESVLGKLRAALDSRPIDQPHANH